MEDEYFFNNVSVDFSRTIYLVCSECGDELQATVPTKEPLGEYVMKIKPHSCE